ncbi:RnfH family protein [Pseudomonas huanghezhanensis]|uniref:RnfH family protein n=1 Tax=Pseudomonas huanghezhanensis TaxID=3002903 RepID=UPI0022856077|nr:RnfH family protein [Pseudomonas sp. BSw22131]
MITVELVYAAVDRQVLLTFYVQPGTTVRAALALSGIGAVFPELDLQHCPVGIFGKSVPHPEIRLLKEGERIEIYRPLLADPKEVRRLRAAKAIQAKKGESTI